jgi:hypothetical protein
VYISDSELLQVNATVIIGLLILLTIASLTSGLNDFIVGKSGQMNNIILGLRSTAEDLARQTESLPKSNLTDNLAVAVNALREAISAQFSQNFAIEQIDFLFQDREELQDRVRLLKYIVVAIIPFSVSSILVIFGPKKWPFLPACLCPSCSLLGLRH